MRLTPLLRLRHTAPLLESLTIPAAPRPAAPTLAYHVARTKSGGIPVYNRTRAGGSHKSTQIQKVHGDTAALRDEIRAILPAVAEEDVVVNPRTNHVVVKVGFLFSLSLLLFALLISREYGCGGLVFWE